MISIQPHKHILPYFIFLSPPLLLSGQEQNQISAEEAIRIHKKDPQTVFVDIRDAKAFGEFHIPGSINLPSYLIKTKAFLKHKRCIIIHRSLLTKSIAEGLEELKALGFTDIHILSGGIHAWHMREGPLRGSHSDHPQTELISYEHFNEHSQHNCWNTILINGSSEEQQMNAFKINAKFDQSQLQDLLMYIYKIPVQEFILVIGASDTLRNKAIKSFGHSEAHVFFLRKNGNLLLAHSRMNRGQLKSSIRNAHNSTKTKGSTKKGCGCKK